MEVKVERRIGFVLVCMAVAVILGACGSSDDGGSLWAVSRIEVDTDADGSIDLIEMEKTYKNGKLEDQYITNWSYTSYPDYTQNFTVQTSYTYRDDGKLNNVIQEYNVEIFGAYLERQSTFHVQYFDDGRPSKMVTYQTDSWEIGEAQGSEYEYPQTYTFTSATTQTPTYILGKLYRLESVTTGGYSLLRFTGIRV